MKERQISDRQEREAERALYQAVVALESVDEARAFFRDLCTPAELQAMADRWAVVGPLERGVPYREIHDRTGVSVTTTGFGRCGWTMGFGATTGVAWLRMLAGEPPSLSFGLSCGRSCGGGRGGGGGGASSRRSNTCSASCGSARSIVPLRCRKAKMSPAWMAITAAIAPPLSLELRSDRYIAG